MGDCFGAFFPAHIQYLTYSFSVQLFFFISGFLFRREIETEVFWAKNRIDIIIPYFLLGGVNCVYFMLRATEPGCIMKHIAGFLLGISNFDNCGGCGGLWFVATLLVLKVIVQYITRNKELCLLLGIMIPSMVVYRHMLTDLSVEWYGFGIGSTFEAYPFFLCGFVLSNLSYEKISEVSIRLEDYYKVVSLLTGLLLLLLLYFFCSFKWGRLYDLWRLG